MAPLPPIINITYLGEFLPDFQKKMNVTLSGDRDELIGCSTGNHRRVVAALERLEAETILQNPYPTFLPPHQYHLSR